MGIGQSYESYEKELLDREVTKGFEDLEEAINNLNDAANNLLDKKGILGKDKLHMALDILREFENMNESEPEWDLDDTDYREREQEADDYVLDSWGF
jgi:hypothetical protein